MKRSCLPIALLLALVLGACSTSAPTPTAAPAPPTTAATAAPAPAPTAPAPASAVTAASATPTSAQAAQPVAAKPTGELKIALGSLATETWDPVKSGATPSKFIHRLIYDYLIGAEAETNALSKESGIARDWEMSPDAMKFTIYLRKDVKFHTGDEVTADDVKFNLERVLAPTGMSDWANSFRTAIKNITVTDKYTIVINMKEAWPLAAIFLSPLPAVEGEVYPKSYLEKNGEVNFGRKPVGTGPYRLVEHVPGQRVVLEAFEEYWRGAPKYKKITFLSIPEESTRIIMMKRGEADMADLSVESVSDMKKAGFNVFYKKDFAIYKISVSMGKAAAAAGKPITKLPVRQALSLAVNRQELAESLFYGQATPSGTQFGPYAAEYEFLPPDPYDPAKAKQLLAGAGCASGCEIEYLTFKTPGFPELEKLNEAVAGYWKAVGVNVKLVPIDRDAWLTALRKGDLQKAGQVNGYPTQNQYLTMSTYQGSLHPKGRQAYLGMGDDYVGGELASMIDKASSTIDDKERMAILRDASRYVIDNKFVIPLVLTSSVLVTNQQVRDWDLGKVPQDFNIPYLFRTWKP